MIYILFNPKANNENNDISIVTGDYISSDIKIEKLNLIGLDVAGLCEKLIPTDKVIICGGDGTLHHFANNTYGLDFPCPVYVARSGTGNDFLNDIGQTKNDQRIDIRPYLKDIPTVFVDGKKIRFINGAGLGVDGAVCRGVEEFKAKTNKKKASYTLIALKELAYKYKRPNAKITVDGVEYSYSKVWAMSSMKGRYLGGGMKLAPAQDRNSGKISIMAMHGGSRLKTLAVFTKVKSGDHVKHTDMVEMLEGYSISVEFDTPCDMQIDGEVLSGITSYRVECDGASDITRELKDAAEAATV